MTLRLPLVLLLLVGLLPTPAAAHQQLLGAQPAQGTALARVPEELRLSFNQVVRPELAELRLMGPGGEVALGDLLVPAEEPKVLTAAIAGSLLPGEYTVSWLVTGDDGHPVRGEYTFTIDADAAGLQVAAPEPAPPAPDQAVPVAVEPAPAQATTFDVESPLYALVRWLTFVGLLVAVGAVAFRLLVLPLVRYGEPAVTAATAGTMARRAAGIGLLAAGLLAAGLVLRLAAQSAALGGPGEGGERLAYMLTDTPWGWGWMVQAAGVLALLAGWTMARRGSGGGWWVASAGALALCVVPGLSGHAAAASAPAVVADALHVLAAGGWLGTLLLVIGVGIPTLRAAGLGATPAAAALLRAFSPFALGFAALLTLTGVYAAWLHLGGFAALSTSSYGKTLLVKLGVLSVVFATGAHNWLRVRPTLASGGDVRRLNRSAGVELVVALLVLAVTAVLVATPPPADGLIAEATPAVEPAALP